MADTPDCPICYTPIVEHPAPAGMKATGSTKTSCGHTFHPGCLSTWYNAQAEATCPCCRAEATETEKPASTVGNRPLTNRELDAMNIVMNSQIDMADMIAQYANANYNIQYDESNLIINDPNTITW